MREELEGMSTEEMLEALGQDKDEFFQVIEALRSIHQIAQSQMLLVCERTADMRIDPTAGLLALKYVVDLNVKKNIERGTLSEQKIHSAFEMSAMLANETVRDKQMIFKSDGSVEVNEVPRDG